MSDNSAAHSHDSHTGPIKTPQQLLVTVFFAFVAPVFIIIGLVYFVSSAFKPSGTEGDTERAIAHRIQKVGSVEIRAASAGPRDGETVFKAQCTTCHTAGMMGAPKFGDAGAWGPRIAKGFDALLTSALKGKGNMPPQSGGEASDLEVARALVYRANAGGAKFAEPKAPEAAASAPEAAAK